MRARAGKDRHKHAEERPVRIPKQRHIFSDLDDPAARLGDDVQRREQRGRAIAPILMSYGAGATFLHRQARLSAVVRPVVASKRGSSGGTLLSCRARDLDTGMNEPLVPTPDHRFAFAGVLHDRSCIQPDSRQQGDDRGSRAQFSIPS